MNDEQYRQAQLETSHADTRRRTLALEVEMDRLRNEMGRLISLVDQLRQALHIVDLG